MCGGCGGEAAGVSARGAGADGPDVGPGLVVPLPEETKSAARDSAVTSLSLPLAVPDIVWYVFLSGRMEWTEGKQGQAS